MYRTSRLSSVAVALAALAAIITLTPSQAEAQVKPFKITGGGLVPGGISLIPGVPAYHNATGVATELGAYSGEGWFTLLGFTGPLTAEFSSAPDFVFTAANGDQLAFTYGDVGNGAGEPGEVTLYPVGDGSFIAVFVAEFNPVQEKSTGRFAKVTGGSFIMVATSEPFFLLGTETTPFAYSWQGSGTLTFKKGK
jgi:hypothetical protein